MAPFKGNLRLDKWIYPPYYFANIGRSWVRVNTLEDDSPKIRGDVLKHAREEKGINAEFLASVICLNKRHIFQIELGDDHYYFYSPKIKVQAAKRIGQYLGLEESTYLY